MPDPQDDLISTEDRENYLKDVQGKIQRYYKDGIKMRRRYLFIRIFSAIGSVIIPVLSNFPLTYLNIDLSKLGVTILGLFVALAISIESVLRYREMTIEYS